MSLRSFLSSHSGRIISISFACFTCSIAISSTSLITPALFSFEIASSISSSVRFSLR
uniref:iron-sulfur cluster assembly scaffold protein n=1 Tax=Methanochimaera problematica TaxID=2609417 RepID=UPI0038CD6FF5